MFCSICLVILIRSFTCLHRFKIVLSVLLLWQQWLLFFLPDLLDGEKKLHQTDFEAIPEAEVFSGKLVNKPFPEERLTRPKVTPAIAEIAIDNIVTESTLAVKEGDDKGAEKIIKLVTPPTPATTAKTDSKPVKKQPEKAIAKEAWVIHLGSFKDKENVAILLKKLKKQGYIAFTKPIKTKQGILTKVIIGPETDKVIYSKKNTCLKKTHRYPGEK